MAEFVLENAKLWLGGYDLSGDMNALALEYGAETQDNTTFGQDTRTMLGGLKTVRARHEGLWNGGADQVDDVLFSQINVANTPMTFGPQTGADGEAGYSFQSKVASYAPGASVGEMFAFNVSAEAAGAPLVRGTIMHNAARTATGNGTARQLGAVAVGQKLYAALHVVAVSGTAPTLDVTVESDDASGFASGITRGTFTQATAIGAQWLTPVAGAITDDWWRVGYTIGGTTPSFTFIVIVGIQ
jgi:hypothetical protein